MERGFAAAEAAGLAAAGVLILIFPQVKTQVGLAAAVIVMMLIVNRAVAATAAAAPSVSPAKAQMP